MKKNKTNVNWIITITILTFIISMLFSLFSELVISNVDIIFSIVLTILFIVIGVIFDMIGVAVTSADIAPLNSMASRKIKGAKMAIKLKQNAAKVASFCNDVIGDICGIVSGSAGAVITVSLIQKFSLSPVLTAVIVTSVISALTIGGKAIFKTIAVKNGDKILFKVANLITFRKEK